MKITIEYLENPQHEFHHHWCVLDGDTVIAAVPNYLTPQVRDIILSSIQKEWQILSIFGKQKLIG